jgi:hypothetical protein
MFPRNLKPLLTCARAAVAQRSEEEVLAGRRAEQVRRERYYADLYAQWWKRLWWRLKRKMINS